MSSEEKEVRVKFLDLNKSQEQSLRKFINEGIMGKQVRADRGFDPGSPKERREDVRVFLNGHQINVKVHKSKSFEERMIKAKINDISAGGMSIKIPAGFGLSKNGTAAFALDFLEPGQIIRGMFLGLQYDD